MITFMEVNPPLTDTAMQCSLMHAAFLNLDAGDIIRYRIYRSTLPLTSEAAVQSAEFVDEILPLSMWDHDFYGINEGYHGCKNFPVPAIRYPVNNLMLPPAGTGIYVNRFKSAGAETAYYLVSHTINGAEDFSSLNQGANATGSVEEAPGKGMVLLRAVQNSIGISGAQGNSTGYYYVRWESSPNANLPGTPHNYLVALPPSSIRSSNFPVALMLHCWGGSMTSGYGWWYRADEGSMLVSTIQNPYDWWTAYHENHGTFKSWNDGTVQPFTQIRTLSFLHDFVKEHYSIDTNRILLAGLSMGGSGASMWGLRSGHIFSHIISWVGVHIARETPGYYGSYSSMFGDTSWHCGYSNEGLIRFGYPAIRPEDNVDVWDYWDNEKWLRDNPKVETPWMSHANGKNDGGIGWPQAWKNTRSLIDTKCPYNFSWGQGGHGERAQLIDGTDRVSGLDFRLNQSLPVFTSCTLDRNLGATPDAADSSGQTNRYFKWDINTVVDEPLQWEMTMWLIGSAPAATCTADLTPRRLQQLMHGPGSTYSWQYLEGATELANGNAVAGSNGIITITGLQISKTQRTIKISCDNCVTGGESRIGGYIPVSLFSIVPNPFNPSTSISFTCDGKQQVRLAVYDLRGQLVRSLKSGIVSGSVNVVWDGRDRHGKGCSTGIYVFYLNSGKRVITQKAILLK